MRRPVLLVFAHPDDESFGLSGTILKYTRQGVPLDLVCATRGEKGSRLDVPADRDTGDAREAELRAAAALLKSWFSGIFSSIATIAGTEPL